MGRIYTANFNGIAVAALVDLFHLFAPSDAVVDLHWMSFGQTSDAGDAEDELLGLIVHRGGGSPTGSGGAAVTPNPINEGDAAFGGTVRRTDTTVTDIGTILFTDTMNVRAPYSWIWTPETRPRISPSQEAVISLLGAPADSLTINGCLCFEALGG